MLSSSDISLRHFNPVPIGKTVTLLTASQANPALFRDIKANVDGVLQMLIGTGAPPAAPFHAPSSQITDTDTAIYYTGFNPSPVSQLNPSPVSKLNPSPVSQLLPHLLALASSECEVNIVPETFIQGGSRIVERISAVVIDAETSATDFCSRDSSQRIPDEFFSNNEENFRQCVLRTGTKLLLLQNRIVQYQTVCLA